MRADAAFVALLAPFVAVGCTSQTDGLDRTGAGGTMDALPDMSLSCTANQPVSGCPASTFCETPPGICGATQPVGWCVQIPVCTTVSAPVCGCNGKTYQNDCFRQVDNTGKAYDGACGTQLDRVADGTWGGGNAIELQVSPTGATSRFGDCNSGTIDEPLVFWDAAGHFSARGTYDYQIGAGRHGQYPALYAGLVEIAQGKMALSVTWFDLESVRHELGPFTLTLGTAGTLPICP